ncbi:MAG: hypothetical protein J4G04_02595 [Nitrosopumilaceae archaeon]|nr:hypothetical protein [Nitrosopumilaceae archaeon]
MRGVMLALAVIVAAMCVPAAWSQSDAPYEGVHLDGAFEVAVFSAPGHTYALVGAAGAIQVVDVTDPHSPAPVSVITGQMSGFEGMEGVVDIEIMNKSHSTYAIAADYVNGTMWVIDITDPRSPVLVSRVSGATPGFGGMGSPAAVETLPSPGGPHLLVASAGNGTLHIVDMADPSSPEVTSTVSASGLYALDDPRDVEVFHAMGGTYAMVAAFGDNAVLVLDVTNPDAPKWAARLDHGQNGFSGLAGPEDIEVSGTLGRTYAFVAGGGPNTIQVIDMTDPRKPLAVDCIWHEYGDPGPLGRTADIDIVAHDAELFVRTHPNVAIRIQSVSGGQAGPIDCAWRGSAERDTMNHPADMEVFEAAGRTYLLTTGTDGIHVTDITKPWDARPLAVVRDGDGARLEDPYGLAIYDTPSGTYGVVASFGDDSLQVLDITDPSAPATAGSLVSTMPRDGPLWPADASVFGTFGSAYVLMSGARDDAIQILDITDPAAPVTLYTLREGPDFRVEEPGAVETYWDGERAYGLIAERDSVLVMDVTEPASPILVHAISDAGGASILHAGTIHGRPHLLAVYDGAVNVFDMGDPANPVRASSLAVPPGISDIETFRISNVTYASISFRDHDTVYLHGAVSSAALSAVAGQATGLEAFWGFGHIETAAVFDRVVMESAAEVTGVLLVSLEDPAAPGILEPWTIQDAELDDLPDATVFAVSGRTYLAAIDRFDYEVKILDITRPDTWGGITSQVIDGKSGFDALTKPVRIESVHIRNGTYGVVAGADGRLQVLDLGTPWMLWPVDSLAEHLVVPHAEGPHDLEVFTLLDRTYVLVARTVYVPYGNAVTILDITEPDLPDAAGGWSGR